ncbi:MAG TPA: glycosyltransferase family 2 protein [Smithella sp.]|nr:glycosyltransferase family 2 protein [Smithella sp.]
MKNALRSLPHPPAVMPGMPCEERSSADLSPWTVSIITPTFNRAYALSLVLDSFYQQKFVRELVVVDDGGSDRTAAVLDQYKRKYPRIKTIYLRNEKRRGAPYSRRRGLQAAGGEFVLFCDDDDFLEENYTEVCLEKLEKTRADIVSGRHFYRNRGESIPSAVARFQREGRNVPPFDFRLFYINNDAKLKGDVELPFTHANFLARRKLLLSFEVDTFYSRGNGFREENDIQAKIHINGGKIIMTNDTHSVHLHPSEAQSGGQRVGSLPRLFWSLYYTSYFFKKYYQPIMERQGKNGCYLKGIIIYSALTLSTFPFSFLIEKNRQANGGKDASISRRR